MLRRTDSVRAVRAACASRSSRSTPRPAPCTSAATRLDLSAKEFALLRVLAADPTRVFTKAELLRAIWGQRTVGTTRTLDSHACRLRRKLGVGGERFIVNVWGVGYRLVDAPAVSSGNLALVA